MFTIQNCSNKILLMAFLGLASGSAFGQELPWPRTFVGQPDFEFLRDEVAQEFRKRKGAEAHKYIATLNGLYNNREVDPFVPTPATADIGQSKYSKLSFESRLESKNRPFRSAYPDIEIGSGVNVVLSNGKSVQSVLLDDNHVRLLEDDRKVKIEVDAESTVVEAIKRENIARQFDLLFTEKAKSVNAEEGEDATLEGLPQFSLAQIDLPEIDNIDPNEQEALDDFLSFLENILTQASQKDPTGLEGKDFTRELAGIAIQSIVTQPLQYVIINQRRYNVGDSFVMRTKIEDMPEQDLGASIDEYIPSQEEIGEDLHKHYLAIKEKALAQYEEKSSEQEKEQGKFHDISVVVKDIERRKVIFSIFGQNYPVKMKFSL